MDIGRNRLAPPVKVALTPAATRLLFATPPVWFTSDQESGVTFATKLPFTSRVMA